MFLISIISFLVIFSVVVFIHELGHYFTALIHGVKVKEFAIGMPPLAKLLGTNKSGTKFLLNYIPFGGYIKMYGEVEESGESKKGAFFALPIYKRASIVVAGVLMNFLFAWGILTILFTIGAKPLVLSKLDFEKYTNEGVIILEQLEGIKILEFVEQSTGKDAGLMQGDIVTSINGSIVNEKNFSEINSKGGDLNYEILRSGIIINLLIHTDDQGRIGAFVTGQGEVMEVKDISYPFLQSMVFTLKECLKISILTVKTFGDVIVGIFTGITPDGVSGPIGIAKMSGLVVSNGSIEEIFKFMALISLSLAVINILPIPILDGGHLLFLGIECIIGGKLVNKFRGSFNLLGFVFLIGIMVFITFMDIHSLFS